MQLTCGYRRKRFPHSTSCIMKLACNAVPYCDVFLRQSLHGRFCHPAPWPSSHLHLPQIPNSRFLFIHSPSRFGWYPREEPCCARCRNFWISEICSDRPGRACWASISFQPLRRYFATTSSFEQQIKYRTIWNFSKTFDVISRYRHNLIYCVPISWCASVYNEHDLAGVNSVHRKGVPIIRLCL